MKYYNIMYSNKIVHVELNEVIRCYQQIKERSMIVEKCWEKQCSENKDHVIACTNCEQDGNKPMKEFCSFHDSNYKIIGRSIYLRKYFLNKVIFNRTKKYEIIIITKNKSKKTVFEKINNASLQINGNRKPMININFIMILNDMQINIDDIRITKSKKTLSYYHNYWNNILKLFDNDYNIILNK